MLPAPQKTNLLAIVSSEDAMCMLW